MITQDYLHKNFMYEDGFLIRTTRPSSVVQIGDKVGSYDKAGYVTVRINTKSYKVHRLIWMYHYGEMPDGAIDHINQVKDDNRIENLRVVTYAENNRNKTKGKGVYFSKQNKKWIAGAVYDYKYHYFGQYDNQVDAINARINGIKALGFHDNHGSYANIKEEK